MATITVRVPEEIKREMKELEHVNWSEVVRQAIAEEIKRNKMRKASQTIDELRAKSKIKGNRPKQAYFSCSRVSFSRKAICLLGSKCPKLFSTTFLSPQRNLKTGNTYCPNLSE